MAFKRCEVTEEDYKLFCHIKQNRCQRGLLRSHSGGLTGYHASIGDGNNHDNGLFPFADSGDEEVTKEEFVKLIIKSIT